MPRTCGGGSEAVGPIYESGDAFAAQGRNGHTPTSDGALATAQGFKRAPVGTTPVSR